MGRKNPAPAFQTFRRDAFLHVPLFLFHIQIVILHARILGEALLVGDHALQQRTVGRRQNLDCYQKVIGLAQYIV